MNASYDMYFDYIICKFHDIIIIVSLASFWSPNFQKFEKIINRFCLNCNFVQIKWKIFISSVILRLSVRHVYRFDQNRWSY